MSRPIPNKKLEHLLQQWGQGLNCLPGYTDDRRGADIAHLVEQVNHKPVAEPGFESSLMPFPECLPCSLSQLSKKHPKIIMVDGERDKACADDRKVNFLSYLLCSASVRFPEGEGD